MRHSIIKAILSGVLIASALVCSAVNHANYNYHTLELATYEGSNQETHPSVVYIPQGLGGHSYWIACTPYPFGNDDYENPSIYASDDGVHWCVPKNVHNPVSGLPADVEQGGYYSDPQLVYRSGTLELWFRYFPHKEKGQKESDYLNSILRMTTSDGVHWSAPQKLIEQKTGLLSPVVLYEKNAYTLWFTDYTGQMWHTNSADGTVWDAAQKVKVKMPKGAVLWHQNMIGSDKGYEALLTVQKQYRDPLRHRVKYSYELYYGDSKDGLDFDTVKPIPMYKNQPLWQDYQFYRSSFVKDKDGYQLYIGVIRPNKTWGIDYLQVPSDYFDGGDCRPAFKRKR